MVDHQHRSARPMTVTISTHIPAACGT